MPETKQYKTNCITVWWTHLFNSFFY